jgi:hypothetical protein
MDGIIAIWLAEQAQYYVSQTNIDSTAVFEHLSQSTKGFKVLLLLLLLYVALRGDGFWRRGVSRILKASRVPHGSI